MPDSHHKMNPLRQKIEQEIRERGSIPFSRYMDLCLYDPELGYYSRNAAQFGKAGDFYTSSDVHAVFGRLLARQFDEMWRALGSPQQITLQELGPGRGLFAQDVLDWSEKKFPDFFHALRYVLVESSPALRKRIEETLTRHLKSGKAELAKPDSTSDAGCAATTARATTGKGATAAAPGVKGTDRKGTDGKDTDGKGTDRKAADRKGADRKGTTSVVPYNTSKDGALAPEVPVLIFANEFFDALPVEILSAQGSLRIDARDGHFVETWAPPSPAELEFLDRYSVHPDPDERIEVPLAAQYYADRIFATLDRGFITIIDYGYTRAEQLAGRHRGTLKAIRQHSVSNNPYEAPGEQDITADVNFTALAAAAKKNGMQTQRLVTQSQFLLGIGEANQFADAFEDCRLPQERAKVALQLKHLVTPAGMGESFHVLVASKGIDNEKVAVLAGLSFGRNAEIT
jgi:SAM-dependent MidA family methyltransferase